ncbi:MAG: FG-GAP-like repeat-containing protein [Actinomycetota bacterium]|nr:FG-GAP-like repeat-containing protein [Actinomycetota bacterium]
MSAWRRMCAVAIALLLIAGPAAAQKHGKRFPEKPPNDPEYDIAEQDPQQHTFDDEQWYLYSFMPKSAPLASDPEGAAGMSIDRAWRKYSIGTPKTVVAYIEGGVNWRIDDAKDIAPKTYLNKGELPRPEKRGGKRAKTYDVNHDGAVTIADYAQDPRLPNKHINGLLTPEDLIVRFSNHRDDDRNGYVDDISGWNFHRDNNDPATNDTVYGHSDSFLRQIGAATNNNFQGAAICPRCLVLPVKAGDEALDRTDKLAEAILFAVDSGVDVIDVTSGELGYSPFMAHAMEYAFHRGVVVAAASNDFDSTDHQSGMFWPHAWPGNGIVSDGTNSGQGARSATTFRERSNYTSWGPHALFSVSTQGGTTSEATPTTAGVAALVAAYGRQAAKKGVIPHRLSADEIKQVVRATASPITNPNLGWPGQRGASWNIQYGYGRPNVYKAMRAIAQGRVPPETVITAPRWYQLFDPTRNKTIAVRGEFKSSHGPARYKLQYALGASPKDADFKTIASSPRARRRFSGVLGRLSLSKIPESFWKKPYADCTDMALSCSEQYTVTLRLQVVDHKGILGEDRRAVDVFHDDSLRGGNPRWIGLSGESQPALVDLNGDGHPEIVFASTSGAVRALEANGKELRGWPVHTRRLQAFGSGKYGYGKARAYKSGAIPPARDPILTPIAAGDLDGDHRPEVVASSTNGIVYGWHEDGKPLRGFPITLGSQFHSLSVPPPHADFTRLPSQGVFAVPVLGDLNDDGTLEIVQAAFDGKIHAIEPDGRELDGWPVTEKIPRSLGPPGYAYVRDHKLAATPVLADLDGDGKLEVVERSQESFTPGSGLQFGGDVFLDAFYADGTKHSGGAEVPGWPVSFASVVEYYGSAQDFLTEGAESPVAADVDGDGSDEIAFSPWLSPTYLVRGDGSIAGTYGPAPGTDPAAPVAFTMMGAFGKFGPAPVLSYLTGGVGGDSVAHLLQPGKAGAITDYVRAYGAASQQPLPNFPQRSMGIAFFGEPDIADVTGDGSAEVLQGADTSTLDAFDGTGRVPDGWPKFTGGWTFAAPAVGDLDGDGKVEVVATTREGYLFVWNTPGDASANTEWWHTRHDEYNSGNYEMKTNLGAHPTPAP